MGRVDGFLDANKWLDDLIESVGATPEDTLALDEIVYRVLVACVIGWLIGRVYQRTFTGKKFTTSLPDTHILLCIGGALIWLVVGNNLVRAFGLAGTIGLIRYRTTVRDPKDTPIILFSKGVSGQWLGKTPRIAMPLAAKRRFWPVMAFLWPRGRLHLGFVRPRGLPGGAPC